MARRKASQWEDDCYACQAMKYAEDHGRMPTPGELGAAFARAAEELGPERAGVIERSERGGRSDKQFGTIKP
jgi:hypothetical protein